MNIDGETPRVVELAGYRGAPFSCILHGSGSERGIAVVFPGGAREKNRIGGSPARPDLHFTSALLQREGFAVLEVWWEFDTAPENDLEQWLDAHLAAALDAASADHELAFLAGRSLGTRAMARLVSSNGWPGLALPTLWLAPPLNQPSVLHALQNLRSPAFVVGGAADPQFDVDEAEGLRRAGLGVVVLEGADHSLELDDPAASARLLADALDAMLEFIVRASA